MGTARNLAISILVCILVACAAEEEVYKEELTEDDAIDKAFEDFVKLSETLEENGRKPTIYASY